jgi:DNA polymerase-3 subunit alpha
MRNGIQIDIDLIPLDDKATYELYQKGATNGTFQFESPGMQKHLQALKPDKFEDLIAMNALYRPGPMEYIPNFISRKHGTEKIHYDLPDMEEYLAETYGITVYQEQVMLLSQKIAGFTKGEADVLRKAMGKKIFKLLEELKPKFINQAKAKGHNETSLEKIWKDWEAFAAYAFNKSHSTCYSVVAYQTGYLKANYPAEYMAAVLTHNQNNIDKVTFFMEECRNQNIVVLGPDVNESDQHFTVNSAGEIRFGLGAIKGTGEAAVQAIVAERKDVPYEDLFDFAVRVNLRAVNKKSFEALAKAGGFDCFPAYHRRQYVEPDMEGNSLIERAISYANKVQEEALSAQGSLFGGRENKGLSKPKAGEVAPYGEIEKLNIEKDLVGLYISGHPLDEYKFEMRFLTKGKISDLKDLTLVNGHIFKIGGIISQVQHRMTKKGSPFGQFTFEDYSDSHTFFLFSDTYLKFKSFLEVGWFLSLSGSVQNRWKSEELEFKISNMEYLGDIREKAIKGLEIQVNLQDINDNLIDELQKLGEEFPGNCVIKLNIYNRYEDRMINVEMLSRSVTIDPNYALIKKIESMVDLRYKVLLH